MIESEDRSRHWINLALGLLAVLFLYSLYLSVTRIYQVDEAQNVFMARVTALGTQHRYYTNGSLILLGPLSWIAGHSTTSEGMFTGMRLLFFGLYWVNLALIPLAAGYRIRSRAFLFTLLLAASMAPLLDYGLEIRHDNVLLGLMLLFWVVPRRFEGPPWVAFLLLGTISGIMQFTAFKAFLYWLPLSAGVLILPPDRLNAGWLKRGAAWSAGLLLAVLAVRGAYGSGGAWAAYVNGLHTAFGQSEGAIRFTPWVTLGRLLDQTPLLLGFGLAVAIRTISRIRSSSWRALGWEGSGPEALVLMLATMAFLVNPVPYPYNLLHLIPFLLIWVLRAQQDDGVEGFAPSLTGHKSWPLLVGTLLFCHIAPFATAAIRHLSWTNERQTHLMEASEALTDPARDSVFDASGLVASRESVGYQWFLHTLVMDSFRNGKLVPLWKQFRANPPQVILRNYRTDWMGHEEQLFLKDNYLALADDCFVLGGVLPPGGGTFNCLHAGRYLIQPLDLVGAAVSKGGMRVDNRPFGSGSVLELAAGPHEIQTEEGARIQAIWVGPRLSAPPALPNRDHRQLFVNWY